ncbi:YheC/YheD family protein [Paenibacillus ferrarius]|uniref:YheC/YheD family endospore coat-associated protein n=1 Tax=Paenibacillus ferrarius TaxID=1469647 RepID=UPI003D2775E0
MSRRPYVGILVNDTLFAGIPNGHTLYEEISFYRDACKQYKLTPCYFRMQDVHLPSMKVHAYVQQESCTERMWIDLPKVIHNRAIFLDAASNQILEQWTQRGIHLFNRWNRYSKMRIHNLLLKNEQIRPHLPSTYPATLANVKMMMASYTSLILKPTNSSIGRGIMKLEKLPSGRWKLTYPASMKLTNRVWRKFLFRKGLPLTLRRKIASTSYLIQQCLPLATVNGRPFDLRVSVQRGSSGEWGITGIVAKVASRKHFLTNVAQGGKVATLPDLLSAAYPHLDPEAVCCRVAEFSLLVARHLSSELPALADLGLDVGITTEGFPLFIECNGKDQRYSFKEAGMQDNWKSTYYNPMAYAKYLLSGEK